jgi:acyl dehydratase
VGNLGMTDVLFPRPVFHGDTIHARTTVIEARESKSRPTNGIVTLLHEAFNQDDLLVASCKRTALMHKRPMA